VIVNLNVAGLLKNQELAPAITEVGFGEFRGPLVYQGSRTTCR
jgi:hypothetical protein